MRFTAIFALGFAALASAPLTVNAATVYFGEDAGLGETARLSATPNADAARSAFTGRLNAGRTEGFEGFANGSYAYTYDAGTSTWTPGVTLPFATGFGGGSAIGATLTARTGTVVEVPTGTNGFGRFPTEGTKLFHTNANPVIIEFDREIAAFGFDGIDVGDFNGSMTVSTYRGTELLKTLTIAHTLNGIGGDVLFWGIVDVVDPFTKVVFGNTAANSDVFGLDRLIVATASQVVTPIPAALPLLASGIVGLAWARHRRRQG